jgi:sec-independent protein translocase protein TatB
VEIFGIGILEVLAVGLLMAIVFGPNRLPEIAKQGGRAVRELREYARDFRDEYLTDFEEIREEYLEVRHELKETDSEFRQEMRDLDEDLRSVVKDAEQDATEALQEAGNAVKGVEDVATGTNAATSAVGTSAVGTTAGAAVAEAVAPNTADDAAGTQAQAATKTDAPPTRRSGAEKRERRVPRGRRRGGGDGDAPARPGKVISINRRKRSE